jgi:hypothetical protein
MRDITRLSVGDSIVHILPVIRGLTSEISTVREAFASVNPEAVAVSLSKEEVDGLRNLPADFEPELSRYDEIYIQGLARFGEVAAPPPCYVAAVEIADSEGVPVLPIDIDEASYTELYCASVSGTTLFRNSTRTWHLRRRAFSADTPEQYVMKIDRAFNNMRGFRNVENQRAEWMARETLKAAKNFGRLLTVIEFERAGDVAGLIDGRPT